MAITAERAAAIKRGLRNGINANVTGSAIRANTVGQGAGSSMAKRAAQLLKPTKPLKGKASRATQIKKMPKEGGALRTNRAKVSKKTGRIINHSSNEELKTT